MTTAQDSKRRRVSVFHKWIANPVNLQRPMQVVLETIGRRTSKPHRTPVGGGLIDKQFWLVSCHAEACDYVRNIKSNNRIRLRLGGKWRTGSAYLMPSDDPHARLKSLPRYSSTVVRALGTDLLTVRIDLD